MASTIKVDKLDPQSGTALEIGTSGDTVTVPSGVGLTLTDSTLLLPTTINTDKIDPKSGTALEIGTSGDTITVPTGAGLTVTDEVKTNKISPATGTAFALGDSGDTFTVPSGATIVNSGTATGFGGAWNLQRTQTASGATTIDFVHGASGVDLTTYKIYKIIAVDLDSSADGVTVKMEYSDDTGSSYETSAYECTTDHVIYGNSNNTAVNSTASAMHIDNLGNAAGETCSFEFTFANPASALNKVAWYNGGVEDSDGALRIFSGSSIWGSTADVDAIRLTMSSGTFSGIIKLYGIS